MSRSSHSSNESKDEGQGYTDNATVSSSSSGSSSVTSSNSSGLRVEFNFDNSRAWTSIVPPPPVQGYEWAPHEVKNYLPYFISTASIRHLLQRLDILGNLRDVDDYTFVVCRSNERACHGREGYPDDFFYVYITLFRDLGIRLPFSEFQMGVLRELNICPAQLHPNGWAFMQAFSVLCTGLVLTPTPASFLYFFPAFPNSNRSWISLVPVKDKQLFTSFNSSYKGFKIKLL